MTDATTEAPGPAQPDTPPLQRLDPAVRLVWWFEGLLAALPPIIAAAVIDFLVQDAVPRGLITAIVAFVVGALAALVPLLRYRRWGYQLREDDLLIRSGLVWRKTSVIPYIRLQFVDTKQGPVERLLGLSQLVVHTAAVGTSGSLPGLSEDAANELRERLSRLEGDTGGL